jgi:hypothetical protein
MSKITLTPNASGTGTFTIASPNSNTNRTLTLPDSAGELLTTTGDGSNLTGIVTADDSINEAKLQVSNAPVNGYALTAQSGNTGGMTWAEMAAGGTTLISTTTVTSAVATVDITLPTGYGAFELFLEGVTPSSTGVSSTLSVRFSSDNGSSYYQTSGSYNVNGGNDSQLLITSANDFNNEAYIALTIQGAKNSGVRTTVFSEQILMTTTGEFRSARVDGGGYNGDTVMTNIRIFPHGGSLNIVAGTFRLYGRAT